MWAFLFGSIGMYTAACLSPALASTTGGPPMAGFECFLCGLSLCWLGLPLLLWSPNLFIVLLWFRVLTGRSTRRRDALVAPIVTALSTLGCCTLYPYRPQVGAWLWIASGFFAGVTAWLVPSEPSGRGVRSVAARRD